ncbi:unnamed protein product [Durusdinium trenchii]|uniref:C3H1-type domain-containing protein n=1 Tax=Durusdinium trenchii TaxID=1381693 RepID=A0ABP0H924_9DINO
MAQHLPNAARTTWFEMTFNDEALDEESPAGPPVDPNHAGQGGKEEPCLDFARDPGTSPHSNRTCDPCVFVASAHGCSKGLACEFCHLDHPAINSAHFSRPHKQRRMRMRQVILQHLQGNDPDEMQQALQREARRNAYMRKLIPSYIAFHFGEPTPTVNELDDT